MAFDTTSNRFIVSPCRGTKWLSQLLVSYLTRVLRHLRTGNCDTPPDSVYLRVAFFAKCAWHFFHYFTF